MKTAVLITIGDEILYGETVDTNSNFIALRLKEIGISVSQIFTIPDNEEKIGETVKKALRLADLVLTTGGLGPTKDDKTVKALARCFDDEIVFSKALYESLGKYLEKRGVRDILDKNKGQCEVLSRAQVFINQYGTAPCQMMEQDGKLLFCLPGVPTEVKPFLKDQIIPYLKERWGLSWIYEQTVSVVGIPESILSERIEAWELALPQNTHLSYLPKGPRIKLVLTARGESREGLQQEVRGLIEQLKPLIGQQVISWSEARIQDIVAHFLVDKKLTISTAESCTTGEIARLLTSVSGSSRYYLGGVIPYASAKKVELLGVSPKTLEEKTVVSAEVAREMAQGCQKLFGTDIALASTGVAGPNKGEDGKEVGTVYYAVAWGSEVRDFHLFLPHFEREDFVSLVARKVLEKLILWLEEE